MTRTGMGKSAAKMVYEAKVGYILDGPNDLEQEAREKAVHKEALKAAQNIEPNVKVRSISQGIYGNVKKKEIDRRAMEKELEKEMLRSTPEQADRPHNGSSEGLSQANLDSLVKPTIMPNSIPEFASRLAPDQATEEAKEPDKALVSSIISKEIAVLGTPIIQKVILNPKVYLWFDWVRTHEFGSDGAYRGDIGDFILDCVEGFWKKSGWEVIMRRTDTEVL